MIQLKKLISENFLISHNQHHSTTVNTPLVTQFLLLQNCVTKGKCATKRVSERLCDDTLMNQYVFHPHRK